MWTDACESQLYVHTTIDVTRTIPFKYDGAHGYVWSMCFLGVTVYIDIDNCRLG